MAKKTRKTKEILEESLDLEPEAGYTETEDTEENWQAKIKKLKDELKKCKKEKQEYLDGWQRARADYANLKVEEEKKRADIAEFTKEDIILSFLPVLDSFDMAMASADWEKVDKNWRVGVENIYNQLFSIFKGNGVFVIEETGVLFNPEFHQSIETVETKNKKDDGKIAEVVSKGYKMNSRILRPARVKIYRFNK